MQAKSKYFCVTINKSAISIGSKYVKQSAKSQKVSSFNFSRNSRARRGPHDYAQHVSAQRQKLHSKRKS